MSQGRPLATRVHEASPCRSISRRSPASGAGIGAATGLLLSQLTKSSGAGLNRGGGARRSARSASGALQQDPRLAGRRHRRTGTHPRQSRTPNDACAPRAMRLSRQVRADLESEGHRSSKAPLRSSLADATARQTQRNAATFDHASRTPTRSRGSQRAPSADCVRPRMLLTVQRARGSPATSKSDAPPSADSARESVLRRYAQSKAAPHQRRAGQLVDTGWGRAG